jgi:hypothetical protein
VQRVRITYQKGAAMRFIGHLDVLRLWERAFRRARLPMAYTLGYTPHPRLTFAAPLALGATGEAELLDALLTASRPVAATAAELARELPPGCALVAAQEVPLAGPALPALLRWAYYRVAVAARRPDPAERGGEAQGSRWSRRDPAGAERFTEEAVAEAAARGEPWRAAAQRLPPIREPAPPEPAAVEAAIARLLQAQSVVRARVRDGKPAEYDLRPLVLALWPDRDQPLALHMVLRADQSGAGRPEEVADALDLRAVHVHRVGLGLEGDPPPEPRLG